MNYLKSLFGWGAGDSAEEIAPQGQSSPRAGPSARRAAPAAAGARRPPGIQPLLREVGPGGDGGVQGLDWYKASLLKDSDGDTAIDFLSEAGKPHVGDESGPVPKQPRLSSMESHSARALPLGQGGTLVVERGNVTVSPAQRSKPPAKKRGG